MGREGSENTLIIQVKDGIPLSSKKIYRMLITNRGRNGRKELISDLQCEEKKEGEFWNRFGSTSTRSPLCNDPLPEKKIRVLFMTRYVYRRRPLLWSTERLLKLETSKKRIRFGVIKCYTH